MRSYCRLECRAAGASFRQAAVKGLQCTMADARVPVAPRRVVFRRKPQAGLSCSGRTHFSTGAWRATSVRDRACNASPASTSCPLRTRTETETAAVRKRLYVTASRFQRPSARVLAYSCSDLFGSVALAQRIGDPFIVRPVEPNAAELQLASHPPELCLGNQ